MKTLDKMTKAELLGVIATKDAELLVLRDRVSQLSAPSTSQRPAWLADIEARREAMQQAKAEAAATGCCVVVRHV